MIPKECRRLAEVDFPIAQVSHPAREISIRHGHPSTLYRWWARRRRLAACRSMLMALLPSGPRGQVLSGLWNRLGTKLVPKLRSAAKLEIPLVFRFASDGRAADATTAEVRQLLDDLGIRLAFTTE